MTDRGAAVTEDVAGANRAPDAIASFIDHSYLTYLVPTQTELDLKEAFRSPDTAKSIFESVQQRDTLFFDETVDVLLVLKTPWLEDDELQARIRTLAISLEARVVNSSVPGRDSLPAEETIFAGHVQDVADAFVLDIDEEQGDGPEDGSKDGKHRYAFAVWKLPVFLARPRLRPLAPSVVFSASASVSAGAAAEEDSSGTGYLRSGLPASINLLESFSSDPALSDVKPRLSASRVSRVAPLMKKQDSAAQLRALPQLKLPIFPAMHTRIRFSRPNTVPPSPAIVALLEIDFTPHFESEVLLDDIRLQTPDGSVESLDAETGTTLPLTCVSHDNVTFLYLIRPHQPDAGHRPLAGSLHISISATVQVTPGLCTPRLTMAWHAGLDFTKPVNPSFGASVDTGIQRARRPSQLSIGGGCSSGATTTTTTAAPAGGHADSLPAVEPPAPARAEAALPDLGITMSFAGPATAVRPGDVFSWTVHVVNRSDGARARPPRKLALVALPRRRRNEVRAARPPSTASRRRGEAEAADAVLDDNVLHAMQRSAAVDAADVVCLSADTRVGPLGPGACHVAELHFLALREGVVAVEAVRVVDLNSQEHVDIRDLPTVVVEPAVA